jgi:hypothetical protein
MMAQAVSLVVQSVKSPRDVARWLLSQKFSPEAVWTGFALVVALNAIVVGLTFYGGLPAGAPAVLTQPAITAGLLALSLVCAAACVTFAGRVFGGTARFYDLLLILVWLQALRLLVQFAVFLVTPISPLFGALGAIAASLVGLWIISQMVDVAQGFNNLFKAFLTLLLGFFGMAVALTVILPILGLQNLEVLQNV